MRTRAFMVALVLVSFVNSSAPSGEPIRVVPEGAVGNPRQPQAAVAEDGTIFVVCGSGDDVYCSVSSDGVSFGSPQKVGEVEQLHLGKRRGPRVAAGRDAVVVTAIGRAGDVLAWRSSDRGRSWQGPVVVNHGMPGKALEALHALAMAPGGDVTAVWLDLRSGSNEVYAATSVDGGQSWGENRLVYRSPDGTVCECCHPAVAYDGTGGLYVMWRNWLDGNRDMYLARSDDGGRTFGPAQKLGTGSWQLNACPMDGGYLAAFAPGNVTTVWRREGRVYRTDSGESRERLLGTGEQPWAAATSEGAYLIWLGRPEHDLWLFEPAANQAVKLSENAGDPMIAAPIGGRGPVVAVWESADADGTLVRAAIVSD